LIGKKVRENEVKCSAQGEGGTLNGAAQFLHKAGVKHIAGLLQNLPIDCKLSVINPVKIL
jgi:hypothetical protein